MSFDPLSQRDDLTAFRAELRAWFEAVTPKGWQQAMQGASQAQFIAFQRDWFAELAKVGLSTPHWPKSWGGSELTLRHQVIYYEEAARIDSPDTEIFTISLYHLPATLIDHGTQAQRDRYLEGARSGRDIWCQGFSEPNAGSDLASLKTRAERKGDVYVINGQKIWSSYGPMADYCLLLVRTDPTAPKKQGGISYFIMDMKAPGVTVRPIKQINGEHEFCEIFLDNVEIPAENLIGAENDGWRIAQSTLSAERGLIVFNLSERLDYAMKRDLEAGRNSWFKDTALAREYAQHWAKLQAARVLIRRMLSQTESGEHGDPMLASYIKLHWANMLRNYMRFLLRAEGLTALALEPPIQGGGHSSGSRTNDFLRSYGWTISGGTNEVMRNVIAERGLMLPRG